MTFAPQRTIISGITQANPCVVTTSSVHGLVTGQIVRLNIPKAYGMDQLNKTTPIVTVLSTTTFSLQTSQQPTATNVNSVSFVAFTTPSNPGTPPEVVPIGSGVVANATNTGFETQLFDQVINNSTVAIPF